MSWVSTSSSGEHPWTWPPGWVRSEKKIIENHYELVSENSRLPCKKEWRRGNSYLYLEHTDLDCDNTESSNLKYSKHSPLHTNVPTSNFEHIPPLLPQTAEKLTEPDTRNDKWELTINFQLGNGRRAGHSQRKLNVCFKCQCSKFYKS
jgi:hypothetical protein